MCMKREIAIIGILVLGCLAGAVSRAGELDDQLRLIRGSYEDGLYDIAASEARAFLKTAGPHPARGEIHLILGFIAARNGRNAAALQHFKDATRSDAPDIRLRGYYEAAGTAWRMSNFAEAAQNYQAILDENRGGPMARNAQYWLVLSLYRAERYSAVADTVDRLLSGDHELTGDQIVHVVFCRGNALYHLDQMDAARRDMLTVYDSETRGLSGDAAMVLARIAVAASDLRTADLWAIRRLDIGYDSHAHTIRSMFSMENNDWHGVLYHLTAAARDDSLDPETVAGLQREAAAAEAQILADVSEYWWVPVFKWFSDHPESMGHEALLSKCSDWASAQPLPAVLIGYLGSLLPDDAGHLGLYMARICLASGDNNAALGWLLKYYIATEQDPDPGSRLLLARLLTAAGDTETAAAELTRLETSLADVTGDWPLTMQRADLYYQSGMYQKAAALYQDILTGDGVSDTMKQKAMYQLGESYFQMEKWILAGGVFRRYAETWPDTNATGSEIVARRIVLAEVYATRWIEAFQAADRYITDFPETDFTGEMYYLKGLSEANLGRWDAAARSLGQALDRMDDAEHVETVKQTIREVNRHRVENDVENPDTEQQRTRRFTPE